MTRRTLLLAQSVAEQLEERLRVELENDFAQAWNAYVKERQTGRTDLRLKARRDKLGRALFCKKEG